MHQQGKKHPQFGKTVLWKWQYLYIEMTVIAVFYTSVTTVVIGRQNHLHKHFVLNLIQTEWRGKVLSRAII